MPWAGGEFALIESYFAPLAAGHPGSFSLRDDAAALDLSAGHELIATTDMLIAGVHFRGQDDPVDIGIKSLAVNLSDLAAMGARPLGYLLSICWPEAPETEWVEGFVDGLKKSQTEFGLVLLGGDTTAGGDRLVINVTALGEVRAGHGLRRSGAQPGDRVYVSGTIGDAALGLRVLGGATGSLTQEGRDHLVNRYARPAPRVALGLKLLEGRLASACIDVSDGLLADARHIADASHVEILLKRSEIPLSSAAKSLICEDEALWDRALAGGDDYELLFTVPAEREPRVAAIAAELGLPITAIGAVRDGQGASVLDEAGQVVPLSDSGWRHF